MAGPWNTRLAVGKANTTPATIRKGLRACRRDAPQMREVEEEGGQHDDGEHEIRQPRPAAQGAQREETGVAVEGRRIGHRLAADEVLAGTTGPPAPLVR